MNNLYALSELLSSVNILQDIDKAAIQVSQSSNHTDGDYQTNIALKTFKNKRTELNLKKPMDYADMIVKELKNLDNNIIDKVSASIPGFINLKLNNNFIINQVDKPICNKKTEKITIIDYSSPNIAKEMHVGHLRSTIIGDVISNILENNGESIMRINHIGDWGTQFGMLIQYLRHNSIDIFKSDISLSELHKWYKESKKLFDNNTEFNEEAHKRVVELQSGDSECSKIWKKLCDISETSYNEIYGRLNVSTDLKIMGESFYNDQLNSIVNELNEKGLLIDDNGAKLMFPIKNKIPLIVRKSDGGYGYDTTDLAALKFRIKNLNANKIIYVTDSGQALHFQLLFEAAKKAGWADNIELRHVGFGIVLGENGKRIKSRSGDSIKLRDLIEEADEKFLESNRERLESGSSQMNLEDLNELSKIIGSSAIKYADLKQNRNNNYQFSYEKMLDHKGDTIIYQLYSWVRITNILQKTDKNEGGIRINNKLDREILLHLSQFDEIMDKASDNLQPNFICEYLFFLSTKVNEYWNTHKIIGSEDEESIISLLKQIKRYMSKCFEILGINANKIKNL